MTTVRLQCQCGRNLADVTRNEVYPETDVVDVRPRPGVEQHMHQPKIEGRWLPPLTENRETYEWRCPDCRRRPRRRRDALAELWRGSQSDRRVVRIAIS